ncbi:LysR family transcriptional regulator [Chelatococcus sp. SYSU_G07232]|uniref:LysR family transcriptional regulator n=2 Tax=Chelatococcus albus TaxID=3047466 RepID=A0ABT7AFB5_9HYPH|nr:LysR family transcriptional regulator [Chelatococcus sp. SYSU_G07232]MDJ1157795.1 LysR family transcriptional regulator [Chelatococcus sp. SYSU_G07232]
MSWDDFRLVKAIADTKGLTGAAERLGINHSTAFRRLGQLEENLGVRLFERHRSGYAPTPPAEEMVALADRMEDEVATLSRKLAGCELSPSGELRVTTNDTLLMHLLTPILGEFRSRFPNIRLDIVLANQALNLSKRDADIAVRATDDPPETLVGRRLATIHWALYGRRDAFPDGATDADLRSLYDRQWVSLGDNLSGIRVSRFVREHVAAQNIGFRVNTVLGLTEAVEAGIGIGYLPCFIADPRPGLVRLSSPVVEFSTGLWLLTHPDLRHSARVRAFLDFVGAEIIKYRAAIEGERPFEALRELSPAAR